ncbi:hypothetical protein [Neorhizobium sp. P12A]|jgi:hypothetical protein|uniref:hypothetical protein n=1 Tax=Neorhizobium sp. P12A TaxID=2268027 RepID=UPI00165D3A4B|nr:hypothetical protein [Neorhizobium sp. P12A]
MKSRLSFLHQLYAQMRAASSPSLIVDLKSISSGFRHDIYDREYELSFWKAAFSVWY